MNTKLEIVKIDVNTLKPVTPASSTVDTIRGTEPDHFYAIASRKTDRIIGFRQLDTNVQLDAPKNGPATRIRVVPANGSFSEGQLNILASLNLTQKDSGKNIHYSEVVTDAKSILTVLCNRL